jgi:tetratricopeptide (TPR) repeat protein
VAEKLAEATRALERQDLQSAARLHEQALDLDPQNPSVAALGVTIRDRRAAAQAHLSAAQQAILNRQFQAAIGELDRARAIDPAASGLRALADQATVGLADLEREQRRRDEVESALAEAARRLEAADLIGARELVDVALALSPTNVDAQALRNSVERATAARAEEERLEAERRARDARIGKAIESARKARSDDQALRILREELKQDPSHEELRALVREREAALLAARVRTEEERREAERRSREVMIAKAIRKAGKARSNEGALVILRDALRLDSEHVELLALIREREAAQQAAAAARVAVASEAVAQRRARAAADASEVANRQVAGPVTTTWVGKWGVFVGGALAAALIVYVGVDRLRHGSDTAARPPSVASTGAETADQGLTTRVRPTSPATEKSGRVDDLPAATAPPSDLKAAEEVSAAARRMPAGPSPEEAASAALERQLDPLRRRARQELSRGQMQQAVATAQIGLKLKADDPGLRTVLDDVAARSAQEAAAARTEADDSGARSTAASIYQHGLRQERDALSDRRAGRYPSAINGLWAARDTFRRAAGEAKMAAERERDAERARAEQASQSPRLGQPSAPPVRNEPVTTLPKSEPTTGAPAPRTDAPAANPATGPPETIVPKPASSNEEANIQRALRAYEAAFKMMDIGALRRVWDLSASEARSLQDSFSQLRAYDAFVQNTAIKIAPDGQNATVACDVRRVFHLKAAGSREERTTPMVFAMQKRGDTWVIVRASAR